MEQNLSIHDVLLNRSKKKAWPYLGSIIVKNENIPLFDERYGLDYDWSLKVTKNRVCKESMPVVVRSFDGENLSMKKEYRVNDFYEGLRIADGNIPVMRKWFDTRAKYHYKIGDVKMARFLFLRGSRNAKNLMYVLTSYCPFLRKIIIKKFNVFG